MKPVSVPTAGPITVQGLGDVVGRLSILPQVATGAMMNGLVEVANECMEDSKDNYCPFDSGDLRASGIVEVEDEAVIVLHYGGPGSGAEDYALEQHENLTYHHPIGGAKYLELPVIKWTPKFVEAGGQSVRATVELNSTGWASGDWKTIRGIRERPAGKVIGSYARKSGKVVATHYRRNKAQ